jgi:hypothetical protein
LRLPRPGFRQGLRRGLRQGVGGRDGILWPGSIGSGKRNGSFTGYEAQTGSEPALVVCHVSHKTLAALCKAPLDKEGHPAPSDLMRVFERHRAVIEAAAARFARGETSPLVTVRDILLKR